MPTITDKQQKSQDYSGQLGRGDYTNWNSRLATEKQEARLIVQSASHRDRGTNTDRLYLRSLLFVATKSNHYVHVNVVSKSYAHMRELRLAPNQALHVTSYHRVSRLYMQGWPGCYINVIHYKTKISRKRYTFKTSNLHHRVLQVIFHLRHLPLYQQTVVYIRNRQVPKIAFSPSSSSSSFAIRQTNSRTHELLAPFFIPICSVYYKAGLWNLTFSPISKAILLYLIT